MKRKFNSLEVEVGARYNSPIWDKNDVMLLPAFHTIYKPYLEEWFTSNSHIYMNEDATPMTSQEPQELPGYIDKETRVLLGLYYESVSLLKMCYNSIFQLDLSQIQRIATPWVSYILRNVNMSILLKVCRYSLVSQKDYIYFHSIDTMLISLGIYKHYHQKISSVDLLKIAMSAILCDIGMTLLPPNLEIDGVYTQTQKLETQKHTLLGYSFLTTKLGIPQEIAIAALEHHERPDGSGYPYGRKQDHIQQNSIIISLADVFTSQMHDRSFKDRREPVEILKEFIQTMFPVFDQRDELIAALINLTTVYPVTSVLELSTGEVVIVTQTYTKFPINPKVMVLLTADKVKPNQIIEYELSALKNRHITITGVYTQKMLDELKM